MKKGNKNSNENAPGLNGDMPPMGKPMGRPVGAPPSGMPMGAPPNGMPMGGPPSGMPMGAPPNGMPMGGPPNGMPMGAPPSGMPMGGPPNGIPVAGRFKHKYYQKNGSIPPNMRAMAPDFTKIRRALFVLNFIAVLAVFITDLVLYLCGSSDVSQTEFIVGSAINFCAVGTQLVLLKTLTRVDILQHFLPIVAQLVIGTVVASVHTEAGVVTAALCIPIYISVICYNNGLIFYTGLLAVGCAALADVFGGLTGNPEPFKYFPAEFGVILASYFFTQSICHMMNEQKAKMAAVIMEAKRAQAEALEANKAKSLFLANMSHEIRTPINAILGMNEMILREERDPTIRDYASNIYTSGSLLLSIINDVLDISKIESGKFEINPTTYDVSSLINDCYNMTVARAKKKNIDLNVEFSEELPRLLLGDEPQIRQIIVNLLTNVVKYTDNGKVIFIVFGVTGQTEDEFYLTVKVRDTGIGISEENLKKLFTQFTRFDLEHNRNIEGTGLGLTIVKHLVDMMNGEISVTSELGKGSEFTVKLPQKVIDPTPTGHIELNYSHNSDYEYIHTFEAPDAHVLAVDDLPVNLMVITNMLKDLNMNIDTAKSGMEALEKARQTHYDIILMDHMMPEMDGIETYKRMRADPETKCADTPVVVLTANALSGVRERYINEGFTDYLSKPVRGEKLEAVIQKYLPPELIKEVTEKEQPEEEESPAGGMFAPLIEQLPTLNLAVAMPYCCESEELLLEILRDYAASPRYEQMQEQFANEDFEGYRINAHSLKSTSLTIGLDGLSERARASEFALKQDNERYAKMNHDELMAMYAEALEKIRAFLETLPKE